MPCQPMERWKRMGQQKRIARVAHDNKKQDLLEWARFNRHVLAQHEVFATGTTGKLLEEEIGLAVHKLQSGPLGGDQQIGAKIVQGEIELLVFFWDPQQAPQGAGLPAIASRGTRPLPHTTCLPMLLWCGITMAWRHSAQSLCCCPTTTICEQRCRHSAGYKTR